MMDWFVVGRWSEAMKGYWSFLGASPAATMRSSATRESAEQARVRIAFVGRVMAGKYHRIRGEGQFQSFETSLH